MVDPKTLAALPLFAGLERDGLSTLAHRALERSFRPGQLLFSAGSQPTGLLVIMEGRVRVVRGRDARQQVIHDEGPGGALGEIPVFGGGTYPATAVAAEPTRCVLILTDALLGIASRNPDLALAFVRRLGERTRQLVTRMADLAVEPVSRRLIRLILERSNHAGTETPETHCTGPESDRAGRGARHGAGGGGSEASRASHRRPDPVPRTGEVFRLGPAGSASAPE